MSEDIFAWHVEATIPHVPDTGRPFRQNINLQVVASSLEVVVDAVKERYEDVVFIKVFRDRWIKDVIVVDADV